MEKRVLIVGDLHISDRFTGRHKDYLQNCFDCLDMIEKSIVENKVTHLICLGDWIGIGQAEKTLRKRSNLMRLLLVLKRWNDMLDGNVYSLKGNHDIGGNTTDFDLMVTLGYLKNVDKLDIDGCRIHMFNYGEETRQIEIDDNKSNIGCFHSNLLIEGETTWYRGGVGVELSSLDNLYGISMAIAGHIHNPSPRTTKTSIRDMGVSLIYPGCPTRPRLEPNMWDTTLGVILKIEGNIVLPDYIRYKLKPYEEIFNEVIQEADMLGEDAETLPFDMDSIGDILGQLQYYGINDGKDYVSQIKKVAGLDKPAADIALKYIEDAEAEFDEK
jgi:predicted phosphodiesterase